MNYQRELDKILSQIEREGRIPRLLLHSCCAPCSSYVLEYLNQYFDITLYYYNPNIYPEAEYSRRIVEQQRLIGEMETKRPIHFIAGPYDKERFCEAVRGVEDDREGGERCMRCYRLRLESAARLAKECACDYFTTTLSISPHKDAGKLNEIGTALGREYGVEYLLSDFKKKNGYKRSIELSKQYGLYRQNYCGCVYSYRRNPLFTGIRNQKEG